MSRIISTFKLQGSRPEGTETGRKAKLLIGLTMLFLVAVVTGRGAYMFLSRDHNNITTQGSIAASCASSYTSLSGLTNGASDVIVGTVLPQSQIVHVGAIPFTLTSIKVNRVVKGTTIASGAVVSLRQLGPGGGDAQPIVRRGHTVLLFLSPFAWTPGQPVPGQFVDQGCGQGLYEGSAASPGTFVSMDSSMGHLPTKLTLADVNAAINYQG